ncbi:MAG TPA: formylglycine-generating enzyme family protein [Chryseolinea sp.]|nr:formylglycine-generating enzyme family protein [Chryseolinea sp.]
MYSSFSVFILCGIFLVFSCSELNSTQENNINQKQARQTVVASKDLPFEATTEMVTILGGEYIPLYGRDSIRVHVNDLLMDVYPVTNENFAAFVKKNRRWGKSQIKKIFADDNYLMHWQNDTTLGISMNQQSPVTNVSWYAAKAYCECQGKRMPTVDEWEYVAMADQESADARKKGPYNQYILDWYERPKTFVNPVGKTFQNYWGVYDLHGLVWEWTSDFSSTLLTGESRNDVSSDKNLFCGDGSLKASDLMNYAAFLRYAFRSSVRANYGVQNLGFRCVKDLQQNEKE